MPLMIPCPSCKARLKAPENLIGKTVKCPNCQTPIAVKAPAEEPPARQPAAKPRKAEPEPVEDFEDLDERPARKPAARKPARDEEDDYTDAPPPKKGKGRRDDDDIVEAPPKKGKGKPAPVDDFDDIEADDYDAPKKGKGKKDAGIPTARVTEEDKTNAFNMYLYYIICAVVCGGLAPFVFLYLWLSKRKESPLVDWHGKQIVNAWITGIAVGLLVGVIYGIGFAAALALESVVIGLVAGGLALVLAIAYNITVLIIFIMGMMKAKAGIYYRYPFVLHLLK